jgi:hypothetical protein
VPSSRVLACDEQVSAVRAWERLLLRCLLCFNFFFRKNDLDEVAGPAMMDVVIHADDRQSGDSHEVEDEEDREKLRSGRGVQEMESELVVSGAIVDSWVEPSGIVNDAQRLVLQVAPKGRPRDLVIVEAKASLVPDLGWLEDLGENLCHGSPVMAIGRRMINGFVSATCLQFAR